MSADQSKHSAALTASPLLAAIRRVCAEIERSDSGHAALLVAVGAKLIAHDAAIALIGEAEWYEQLRRYARLAEEHRSPLPFDSGDVVERLTSNALRGWSVDWLEAAKVVNRPAPPPPTLVFQQE